MIQALSRGIAATAALLVVGCGAEPRATGDWMGTVYDSVGVLVVDNPERGLWTPGAAWRLEEELRIGVPDGDPVREFGRISDIGVDRSGRMYVLERHAVEIRVFDDEGEFVHAFGRPGGGPGELASPSAVLIGAADTVFIPDTRNQRVQRFLADGSEAGSFTISPADGIPLTWRIRPDGLLIEEVRTLPAPRAGEARNLLIVRRGDGVARETLMETPVGDAMVIQNGQPQMTMFAPEPLWTMLTDGRVASGRNSEYRIELRTADGRLDRVVRRPFERQSFSESDRRTVRAMLRERLEDQPPSPVRERMIQSMKYADHYPVYASLFGGPDGTLWVRHAKHVSSLGPSDVEAFDVRAFGAPEYDVFDREGRFLGVIATPDRFQVMQADAEHVYGVLRDDLGVQRVVRLRVRR
ncbi:MAG: 6-bladed beta-propeller [Longimicrobiales bacterium]